MKLPAVPPIWAEPGSRAETAIALASYDAPGFAVSQSAFALTCRAGAIQAEANNRHLKET